MVLGAGILVVGMRISPVEWDIAAGAVPSRRFRPRKMLL
jgi:hypothetical protein